MSTVLAFIAVLLGSKALPADSLQFSSLLSPNNLHSEAHSLGEHTV